ncbi:hypothetical protein ACFVWY_33405 [Streptomyces sp. NPDC058195]|uniref:hypothetical protein n=1 Tax=Streptomyces sp. NPDC058195 TaxID=3346375 RepID=UPI0036E3F425
MTTQRQPFPVPDERAHLFVTGYADMRGLVEDLVVPGGAPEAAATVLRTARELLRQSYYCLDFSTVAVMPLLGDFDPTVRVDAAYALATDADPDHTIRAALANGYAAQRDAMVRAALLLATAEITRAHPHPRPSHGCASDGRTRRRSRKPAWRDGLAHCYSAP